MCEGYCGAAAAAGAGRRAAAPSHPLHATFAVSQSAAAGAWLPVAVAAPELPVTVMTAGRREWPAPTETGAQCGNCLKQKNRTFCSQHDTLSSDGKQIVKKRRAPRRAGAPATCPVCSRTFSHAPAIAMHIQACRAKAANPRPAYSACQSGEVSLSFKPIRRERDAAVQQWGRGSGDAAVQLAAVTAEVQLVAAAATSSRNQLPAASGARVRKDEWMDSKDVVRHLRAFTSGKKSSGGFKLCGAHRDFGTPEAGTIYFQDYTPDNSRQTCKDGYEWRNENGQQTDYKLSNAVAMLAGKEVLKGRVVNLPADRRFKRRMCYLNVSVPTVRMVQYFHKTNRARPAGVKQMPAHTARDADSSPRSAKNAKAKKVVKFNKEKENVPNELREPRGHNDAQPNASHLPPLKEHDVDVRKTKFVVGSVVRAFM